MENSKRGYFLGYNQKNILKYGLHVKHIILLKYLSQFFSSGNAQMITVEKKKYCWIGYSKIQNDLPILEAKKRMIQIYIDDLVKVGILTKYDLPRGKSMFDKKMYLSIDESILTDPYSEDPKEFEPGMNLSLKDYCKIKENMQPVLWYNEYYVDYKHRAIHKEFIEEYGLENFNKQFRMSLKMLMSDLVYGTFRLSNVCKYYDGGIKIALYEIPKETVKHNLFKIEQALCDAYTVVIKEKYKKVDNEFSEDEEEDEEKNEILARYNRKIY